MRGAWLLLVNVVSVGVLWPQQASLTGPVEAYTFDLPTHSFRAVIGSPGSAVFGPALASGFDAGWVAPHTSYAIAYQNGSAILVAGLDSGQVWTTPLTGLNGQPDGISWAADASKAVLYSAAGNWVQVLSGLPGNPQAAPAADISALNGNLSAVAIDRRGQNMALAVEGDGEGVFLLNDNGSVAPLLAIGFPAALAFSDDGTELFVLDGAALALDIVTMKDASVQTVALDGLQNPLAIASGRDSQNRLVLFIASGSDHILRVYDPAAQQTLTDLPLDFKPTGIATLGLHSSVLAPRSQATDPLWLLSSSPWPAIYFVPAVQAGAGGSE